MFVVSKAFLRRVVSLESRQDARQDLYSPILTEDDKCYFCSISSIDFKHIEFLICVTYR